MPALPLDAWANISSQNRWEGVIFAGDASACIFVQPKARDGKHFYNANWSVQNKGVLIVQKLKTSTKAIGQNIWFGTSLKLAARDGWVFAEAPRAYAAVRAVDGAATWQQDIYAVPVKPATPAKAAASVKSGKALNGDDKADGKSGVAQDNGPGKWLVFANEFSPVIIEVVRKSDCPTFAAFQDAILKNPLKWANSQLDYQSSLHKTQLTFHADYAKVSEIDGMPVNYAPKKVYDSPFIQGEFGNGIVTIQKGEHKEVLDFTKK